MHSIKEQPDGNYEVVTEDTSAEELETGNIIVVPAQEDGVERAIEVTNVTKTEEGYVIEGEEPDSIFDVVESVDTQGTAEVDTDAVDSGRWSERDKCSRCNGYGKVWKLERMVYFYIKWDDNHDRFKFPS